MFNSQMYMLSLEPVRGLNMFGDRGCKACDLQARFCLKASFIPKPVNPPGRYYESMSLHLLCWVFLSCQSHILSFLPNIVEYQEYNNNWHLEFELEWRKMTSLVTLCHISIHSVKTLFLDLRSPGGFYIPSCHPHSSLPHQLHNHIKV